MHGRQDDHESICDTLVHYILLNKEVFIPSTAESLDEHLQRMQLRCTWATHLKIFAAASLRQIPIYITTQRSKTMVYHWEIYNPQSSTSLQHCTIGDHGLRHLELAHVQRCHYETVKIMMEANQTTPHN